MHYLKENCQKKKKYLYLIFLFEISSYSFFISSCVFVTWYLPTPGICLTFYSLKIESINVILSGPLVLIDELFIPQSFVTFYFYKQIKCNIHYIFKDPVLLYKILGLSQYNGLFLLPLGARVFDYRAFYAFQPIPVLELVLQRLRRFL